MLGLLQSGQSWRDMMGQGVGAESSQVGKFSKACSFRFFPLFLEIKVFLPSLLKQVLEEYLSPDCLMTCFREGEGKLRETFLLLPFSQALQLKIFSMPRCHILVCHALNPVSPKLCCFSAAALLCSLATATLPTAETSESHYSVARQSTGLQNA